MPRLELRTRTRLQPALAAALAGACLTLSWSPQRLSAWDAEGHVIVTKLAIASLPKSMPDWLQTPQVRARLEYLANEPDRWRSFRRTPALAHINAPDHYIDLEQLEDYGLTIDKIPQLRMEFTDRLATYRAQHPEKFTDYDRSKDWNYTKRVPGMLPYSISELWAKAASSWSIVKTLEAHRDKVTDEELRNARENVVYHMGVLSHFVGDGSQPLHLTVHHHGWVGPNPNGYTTNSEFHAYIDGGVIDHHHITAESLMPRLLPIATVYANNPWRDICQYLSWTHQRLEPLYELEKSGALKHAEGKKFIQDRLLAGGSMLAGLWAASYEAAELDDFLARGLEFRAPLDRKPAPGEPSKKTKARKAK